MKKLEPGMLCRVVQDEGNPENVGKIVTLVKWVGKPPILGPAGTGNWLGDDWWEIEEKLLVSEVFGRSREMVNYTAARRLQPINPDHKPADEEWQADFKRMLSGGQKAKEKLLDRSKARG